LFSFLSFYASRQIIAYLNKFVKSFLAAKGKLFGRLPERAYVQEHPGGQTGGQLEGELLLFPGVIMEILPKT